MTGRVCLILCAACLLGSVSAVLAQPEPIALGSVVEGRLGPGESHEYALTALESTLLSLRVEALGDGLDPVIELYDGAGALVASNDDYAYPEALDAALQAFVMPRTATYTVTARGFGESAGAYRLYALPGYDRVALHDRALDRGDWEVVYSDAPVNISESSIFAVDMRGLARSAGILGLHFPLESELYFEAAFEQVTSPAVWQVGLVFRYLSPSEYHRLLLSKRGYWRIDRIEGDAVTQLRNWTTHPAIRPGESAFRLGVLASGQHYDVVYNGQLIGSAWDRSPVVPGSVGIAMMTDERVGGQLSFVLTETLMTTPTRADDRILFPLSLVAPRYYAMVETLARQQLLPVGGEVTLALAESSVRRVQSGVSRVPVASNYSFAQFAFGASLDLAVSAGGNGGCGLFFHYNDDENYTLAYVTSGGDYGLSRRTRAGFAPGIYGNRAATGSASHEILAIVTDEVIRLYLDERYVGSLESQPLLGGVGIAAVNYEEVETSCAFKDLWLLSIDG